LHDVEIFALISGARGFVKGGSILNAGYYFPIVPEMVSVGVIVRENMICFSLYLSGGDL